jgi:oxygen-dependent protoporphyrinogen oxidase
MHPQLTENVFMTLLRQYYALPRCQSLRPRSLQSIARTRLLHTSSSSQIQRDHEPHNLFSPLNDADIGNTILQARRTPGAQAPDNAPPNDYAVLGGGITGLTTAYYLSKEKPHAKITLYEGSDRLGGWLNSKAVDVGDGSVVFEQGPRTLRPNTPASLVTLELVCHHCNLKEIKMTVLICLQIKKLNLENELLMTSKESVSAQNRFVYYPDHLVKMPGKGQDIYSMIWGVLTEPAFKEVWKILFEYNRPPRPAGLEDESVASFLQRRLGTTQIADNLASAVLHGIYAGDVHQLSVKSLMPLLWHMEKTHGNLSGALRENLTTRTTALAYRDSNLTQEMRAKPESERVMELESGKYSVFSFKKGIGALSEALEKALRRHANVKIKLNSQISAVDYDGGSDSVKVSRSHRIACPG